MGYGSRLRPTGRHLAWSFAVLAGQFCPITHSNRRKIIQTKFCGIPCFNWGKPWLSRGYVFLFCFDGSRYKPFVRRILNLS
jgi:hypothetical protein